MTVYVDLGHGPIPCPPGDPGAVLADGTQEAVELRRPFVYIQRPMGVGEILNARLLGPQVIGVPELPAIGRVSGAARRARWVRERVYNDTDRATRTTNRALSVHLNTGGGAGVECYYLASDPRHWMLAERLSAAVATKLGLADRGAKPDTTSVRQKLVWCRGAGCPGFLLEAAFLDHPSDLAAWRERGLEAVRAAVEVLRGRSR